MESEKHNFWFVFLIIDLVILNSALVFLFLKPQKIFQNTTVNNGCNTDCQKSINSKLDELSSKLEELKLSVTPIPTPTIKKETVVVFQPKTSKTKKRTVSYINIPTSGSILAYDWTDIPATEFYFDTNDYPGLVNIYFESNMKLLNGNGLAFIRLYDSNHGIGVQGSDVQTNSQSDTVVTSGQVTFLAGKNLIKVQSKSLTADTTVFNSGRLRITTEN
jgi:hypothetical protein